MGDAAPSSYVAVHGRRRGSLALRVLTPVLAVLAAGTPARADEPPQPPPAAAIPEPPPPRDYDAPDPDRYYVTYLRAAANASFVNYLSWQYDWLLDQETIYRVTGRDIINNHIGGFPFDQDTLNANFFGHPYGGAMLFGAARSPGLGFWESVPYVIGGSLMWELLSENQKPSTNDMISTTLGGIAVGEILYRVSSLALNDTRSGLARLTREVLAFGIDPPRGGNRLVTGEAWADGPPPVPKYARIAAHGGVDQVSAGSVTEGTTFHPSALVAVDVEYGDLLPAESKTTIPVYDFFDFYASAVISSQTTNGFQVSSLGLLHGWSTDMSSDEEGAFRDNNVFGLVQSFDYQGTDAMDFAGFGLGVGDLLSFRGGPGRRLRLGFDAQWAPLAGVSTKVNPNVGTTAVRDYNYSMGASLGLSVRWDIGRAGQLGLSAREYGTAVIEGVMGEELFGYARAWYEIDAVPGLLGVGGASKVMHRAGRYTRDRTDEATQLSLELYATVRL